MGKILDRLIAGFAVNYLRLIRATGKITLLGRFDLINSGESFALAFWHGDSFCYYPLMPDSGHVVVTTSNKRGAVVEMIGSRFGYTPIRLPDQSDPNISLLRLRHMLSKAEGHHICFSMDGPSGPRHVPSRFFLTSAFLSKKRILPISISVRRKVRSKKRWDKYIIPLPFARLTFTFHQPLEVNKSEFDALSERIIQSMNS
jgi:lysophospholipid acyltransferase (LPLAT)-like uncharacterized protein